MTIYNYRTANLTIYTTVDSLSADFVKSAVVENVIARLPKASRAIQIVKIASFVSLTRNDYRIDILLVSLRSQ